MQSNSSSSMQHQPATPPSPTDAHFFRRSYKEYQLPNFPMDMELQISNSEGEDEPISDHPRRECVKRAQTVCSTIDTLFPIHEREQINNPPSPPRHGRHPTRFDDDLARASNAAMSTFSDPRVDHAAFPPHPSRHHRAPSRYSPEYDDVPPPQQTGFISSLHNAWHGVPQPPPTGQYVPAAPYYPRSPSHYDRDEYAADVEDGYDADEYMQEMTANMGAMRLNGMPVNTHHRINAHHRVQRHPGRRRTSRRSRDRLP